MTREPGSFISDASRCVGGITNEVESAATILTHVRTQAEQARQAILMICYGGDDWAWRDDALEHLGRILGPMADGTYGTAAEHEEGWKPEGDPTWLKRKPPVGKVRVMPQEVRWPKTGERVQCPECQQGALAYVQDDGVVWALCPHCGTDSALGHNPDHVVEL